jgi:hypothetical protein
MTTAAEGLINAGAKEVVPIVVAERPDVLETAMKSGVRIFVAGIASEDAGVIDELRRRYAFVPHGKYLFELIALRS